MHLDTYLRGKPGARFALAALTGLLLVSALYHPILNGPFLLDDFAWLPLLSVTSPSPFSISFWNFTLVGTFPLGRGVAMASFALQSNAWPQDVEQFKLVNLAIHLASYVLLLYLLRRIVEYASPAMRYPLLIAWLAATLWAVSPSNVGSVAYVIQRMNLLATLFSLACMLAYLFARTNAARSHWRTAAAWLLTAGLLFLLALLSKENAAVVALVIAVLELKLPPAGDDRLHRQLRRIVIFAPWILFLGYMAVRFDNFLASYYWRDFTMLDRLALAPGLLLRYIRIVFFPNSRDLSLFQDDVETSAGLLLPAVLATVWFAVLVAAVRARSPAGRLVGFGVLWFVAAHLIETTIVPLELYFPHRNYFPSIGVLLAVVVPACLAAEKGSRFVRAATVSIAAAVVAGMLFITFVEARAWQSQARLFTAWQKSHPTSDRAGESLARLQIERGAPGQAMDTIRARGEQRPNDVLTQLETQVFACLTGEDVPPPDTNWSTMRAERPIPVVALVIDLAEQYAGGGCKPFSIAELHALITELEGRADFRGFLYGLRLARAKLAVHEGRYSDAAYLINQNFEARGAPAMALEAAGLLHAAQGPESAIQYLESKRVHGAWRPRDLLLNAMIDERVAQLEQDAASINRTDSEGGA